MSEEHEGSSQGFVYFDSQWGVIQRSSANKFKESVEGHKAKNSGMLFAEKCFADAELTNEKFLPVLDEPNTYQVELELFENNFECVCSFDEKEIDIIAQALLSPNTETNTYLQPAGYTYFAQLLTHDIVSSTSLLRNRNASFSLNLDSIYFDYGTLKSWGGVDDDGKFCINDGSDFHRSEWEPNELREAPFCLEIPETRKKNYYFAVIPEHRNDGNVILSQLNVAFLLLHNQVVDLLIDEVSKNAHLQNKFGGEEYYEKAKQIVTLIFQDLVVHDLLKITLDEETHHYYFGKKGNSLFPNLESAEAIPKEFTHAVSRYAHAMIRRTYKLNTDDENIDIRKLFKKNSQLKDDDKNLCISDWGLFFKHESCSEKGAINRANKILLRAASLPISEDPIKPAHGEINPAKNLATFDITASSSLCTFESVLHNQAVRQFLKVVKQLDPDEYFSSIDYGLINTYLKTLNSSVVLSNQNSPFLISMYLESGAMPEGHSLDRLGVVGSIVYAETIRHSIEKAPINIYQPNLLNELDWGASTYQAVKNSLGKMNMWELTKTIKQS